tara:strand:+ start:3589 stop:4362 length:774 start_codon:yes stop_codon:yes gene_type:complete
MSEQMINLEPKPLENHLQELYSLVKNTILFASISAIGWSVVAPQLLTEWANLFNNNVNINQLSIYSPFNWIEVKWSFSIMMGIITSFPLFSAMLYRFSKPGLYPNELFPVKFILIANSLLLPLSIFLIWVWGVPTMVKYANGLSQLENISARYDLFEIVNFSLGLTFMAIISFILMTSLILSRIIGDLGGVNSWLRPRIIIISFGLLILTMPSVFEGLRIPLSFVIIYVSDFFARSIPLAKNMANIIQDDTALKGHA